MIATYNPDEVTVTLGGVEVEAWMDRELNAEGVDTYEVETTLTHPLALRIKDKIEELKKQRDRTERDQRAKAKRKTKGKAKAKAAKGARARNRKQ